MKRTSSILYSIFLAALLLAASGPCLYAQQSLSPSQAAARSVGKEEHMDAPEGENQMEQYRHSAVVQSIARYGHVSTETAAEIFEDFNSGVLLGTILIVLFKVVPKMLRSRSEKLQQDLVGARLATEEANRRLAGVEARLQRLDSEIDAIRQQVEQEAVHDEKRIHAAMESERERIVASAEQEIAATQAAAQRDLKKFAADLAIDHAMRKVQLSTDTDRALVREFGKNLNSGSRGKA
ncbi:MAG TPA: ATP synthase F0 subunit B [Acidobacteriaceae bacterium]|nr:ATP synthase F0 subunit B [Acidobacteriaceae bacterium]